MDTSEEGFAASTQHLCPHRGLLGLPSLLARDRWGQSGSWSYDTDCGLWQRALQSLEGTGQSLWVKTWKGWGDTLGTVEKQVGCEELVSSRHSV